MKNALLLLLTLLVFSSAESQEIALSGIKYEQTYQPLENAAVLTDTNSIWAGYFDTYTPASPISFFSGALSFEEIEIEEPVLSLFNEQSDIIMPALYTGSETYDIWQVLARPPQDSLAPLGQISIKETDTSVIVEYQEVAYELYDIETDSALFLDAQFSFQVHLDYGNNTIKYHFRETRLGPLGEIQMEDLSILSGLILGYEFSPSGPEFPFIFAEGDPNTPVFTVGEGEFEEIPPFRIDNFPSSGTVFEFSMDLSTSTEDITIPEVLSIFPNPGTDRLTLSYPSSSFTYAIRDGFGHVVQEGRASQNIQISTAAWPAGSYFITVGEGPLSESKIWVKTR